MHTQIPGAPATHRGARHSCQAVSSAIVGAITPVQLEPSKCYLVGVGPGTLDLCTVSHLFIRLQQPQYLHPNAQLTYLVHTRTTLPHHTPQADAVLPLQVKAVRLISSAEALVYDDLGTQVAEGPEQAAEAATVFEQHLHNPYAGKCLNMQL